MQTLFSEDNRNRNLLSSAAAMVLNNFRYIVWFYVLNVTLAEFGAAAFRNQAHKTLDHSLYSERLLRGFDLAVFLEMLSRPDFAAANAPLMSAFYFVFAFFVLTALFLPGVLQGYASTYRLPREDFFRSCGRNLWRFVRLLLLSALLMGIPAAGLFAAHHALVKKAAESTNELLAVETKVWTLAAIFLVMTVLRAALDLAETDVVLGDQNAVRRSIVVGIRFAWRGFWRLLGIYVLIAVFGALIALAGLWSWMRFVPSESVLGAFLVSQVTLLLLLIPRFWQRAVAVAYYQRETVAPVAEPGTPPEPVPAGEPAVYVNAE